MANPEVENQVYSLTDEVWQRVVQIVQEAMLTGVDCADLLRQVRVTNGENGSLVLTADYKKMISEHHVKLLQEAAKIQAAQRANTIIGRS